MAATKYNPNKKHVITAVPTNSVIVNLSSSSRKRLTIKLERNNETPYPTNLTTIIIGEVGSNTFFSPFPAGCLKRRHANFLYTINRSTIQVSSYECKLIGLFIIGRTTRVVILLLLMRSSHFSLHTGSPVLRVKMGAEKERNTPPTGII